MVKLIISFLRVILYKLISLRNHLRTVESKIAKSIGLLHGARQVLTGVVSKTIFLIFTHI